jgi:hypothetical protein
MKSHLEHPLRKLPRLITTADLAKSQSKDEIRVTYADDFTALRSGRAGKPIHVYFTENLTNGHEYWVELQEVDDEPHGYCECPAGVTCKHLKHALEDLMQREPSFGQSLRIQEDKL